MNIKRRIDRPKSHFEKNPIRRKNRDQISVSRSQYRQTNQNEEANDNNLEDFFEKFHETYIVLEATGKTKNIIGKKKKPVLCDLKGKKQDIPYFVKKYIKDQVKSISCLNQDKKTEKVNQNKSVLHKNNKTCQSDRNILTNCQNNVIGTKKRSERKSEARSKIKVSNQNSKKCTTKKKLCGTGSTATTTLGNSAINMKDDIHIASYLRIKIKGN